MFDLSWFEATIGLDWADEKHDLWIRPADGSPAARARLEQTPEALHGWVAQMRARFKEGKLALAVETSRGPVVCALLAYDFIVLFPVNPKAFKDYRASFSVSGAKSDRADAELLEEYLRLHPHKLRALEPDDELTRKLGQLAENRRQLVDDRTALINQAHARLKMYYPLAGQIMGQQFNTAMGAEFLKRWPDLASLQAQSAEKLRKFFYKHNSRSEKAIARRLEAIRSAQPLTRDAAIIEPARAFIKVLANVLEALNEGIADFDKTIQAAMDQHPEAPLFLSFPGVGPALAPRILAAFGTRRERFQSAQEVAQFYGIAPVVIQSGRSKVTRMRSRCPKFGRQTFHETAGCAAKSEPWAKAYYQSHRARGDDKHHEACRALAFKLIRIYFACWKNKTPYRSERYEQALAKNGSPLAQANQGGE